MRIIGGTARGRKLVGPSSEGTRPLSDRARESLFNILGPGIRGERVLDLFAGHRRRRPGGPEPGRPVGHLRRAGPAGAWATSSANLDTLGFADQGTRGVRRRPGLRRPHPGAVRRDLRRPAPVGRAVVDDPRRPIDQRDRGPGRRRPPGHPAGPHRGRPGDPELRSSPGSTSAPTAGRACSSTSPTPRPDRCAVGSTTTSDGPGWPGGTT